MFAVDVQPQNARPYGNGWKPNGNGWRTLIAAPRSATQNRRPSLPNLSSEGWPNSASGNGVQLRNARPYGNGDMSASERKGQEMKILINFVPVLVLSFLSIALAEAQTTTLDDATGCVDLVWTEDRPMGSSFWHYFNFVNRCSFDIAVTWVDNSTGHMEGTQSRGEQWDDEWDKADDIDAGGTLQSFVSKRPGETATVIFCATGAVYEGRSICYDDSPGERSATADVVDPSATVDTRAQDIEACRDCPDRQEADEPLEGLTGLARLSEALGLDRGDVDAALPQTSRTTPATVDRPQVPTPVVYPIRITSHRDGERVTSRIIEIAGEADARGGDDITVQFADVEQIVGVVNGLFQASVVLQSGSNDIQVCQENNCSEITVFADVSGLGLRVRAKINS